VNTVWSLALTSCALLSAAPAALAVPSHEPQRKPAPIPQSLPGYEVTKLSQPPGDFPAPVFRGSNTRYTQPASNATRAVRDMKILLIETSDGVEAVSSWYARSMAASGWKPLSVPAQTLPAVPGIEQIYAMRPQPGVQRYEKEGLRCEVTIGGVAGGRGQAADTTVRMSVVRSR